MPELPEVETVTRALRPHLVGRRILAAEVHADRLRRPLALGGCWPAGPVLGVRRRAKYIIVELAGGQCILLHLGMTGGCRIVPREAPRRPHEHIVWLLDNGMTWRLNDPRKFGMAEVLPLPAPGGEPACLADLGPEPLEDGFTGAYLYALTRGRNRPIKTLLMDNAIVVGVGNIYANEAVFRIGLRPRRAARRLTRPQCDALVAAVRKVLRAAIDFGGTTIIDFAGVDGSEGRFRNELHVYGRDGESCIRCGGGPIKRVVLAGRSTYYCPACQRP